MIIDILLGYALLGLTGSAVYIIYYQIFKTAPEKRLFIEKPLEDILMLPIGLFACTIAWPYFVYAAITHQGIKDQEEFSVNFEDLDNEVNVDEVEKKHLIFDPLDSVPNVPFGYLNSSWAKFLNSEAEVGRIFSFKKVYKRYSFKEIKKGYAAVNDEQQVTHYFIYDSQCNYEE
jgi:hypothetical protein